MDQEQDLPAIIANTDKPILWKDAMIQRANAGAKRIRQVAFLKALAQCGMVSKACKAIGINTETERQWRQSADKWYTAQFKDALQFYRDSIEQEVHNRAIVGEQVPIIGRIQTPLGPEDAIIGHKTVKSDLLLMFHAKRHIKEYNDKYDPKDKEEKPVEVVSPMARISIRLDMISERRQQSIEGIVESGSVIDVTPEAAPESVAPVPK